MKLTETFFDRVKVIEPLTYSDERGTLTENINPQLMDILEPDRLNIVLEYISTSKRNVLRGLHYQVNTVQGKLVTVLSGSAFDVIVDLRRSSKTLGQWACTKLNGDSRKLVWIPPGFAHGFLSLSDGTVMSYKCTGPYSPQDERCIRWDDNNLAVDWPQTQNLIISDKDRNGLMFANAPRLD